MSNAITLVHPVHGEAIVGLDQWNAKFPEGEASHGWCEKEATARGWKVKDADAVEPEPTDASKAETDAIDAPKPKGKGGRPRKDAAPAAGE